MLVLEILFCFFGHISSNDTRRESIVSSREYAKLHSIRDREILPPSQSIPPEAPRRMSSDLRGGRSECSGASLFSRCESITFEKYFRRAFSASSMRISGGGSALGSVNELIIVITCGLGICRGTVRRFAARPI